MKNLNKLKLCKFLLDITFKVERLNDDALFKTQEENFAAQEILDMIFSEIQSGRLNS